MNGIGQQAKSYVSPLPAILLPLPPFNVISSSMVIVSSIVTPLSTVTSSSIVLPESIVTTTASVTTPSNVTPFSTVTLFPCSIAPFSIMISSSIVPPFS